MNDLIELYAPAYHDGIIAAVILHRLIVVSLLDAAGAVCVSGTPVQRPTTMGSSPRCCGARGRRRGLPFPLLGALIAIPYLTFPARVDAVLVRVTAMATTIAVAWAIVASIGLYADLVKRRYSLEDRGQPARATGRNAYRYPRRARP